MELQIVNQPRVRPHRKLYSYFKRVIDVTVCIMLMPIALPLMALCAVAIYLNDPHSPVFFVQERIGIGGRPFQMIKLRTMRTVIDDSQAREFMKAYVKGSVSSDDEDGSKIYKPDSSKRVFLVGRILRKTSLDELPQIFNILKGQMSFVGPRPNVPWEVDAYQIWHHERLEVKPGLTGLAQVHGRSSINFNSLVRYDIAYIENQSMELDLKILWWTFKSILSGRGAN